MHSIPVQTEELLARFFENVVIQIGEHQVSAGEERQCPRGGGGRDIKE